MKKYVLTITLAILFWSSYANACELFLSGDKDQYRIGDTAIITLTLKLTHKNCALEGHETKVKVSSGDLVAKTKFKESSPAVWQIKYKIIITGKDASVQAIQDCTAKGGSANKLKFNVIE
jgi:hypothetical protein